MKKIEDILFYSATKVQPPKEGLEKILDNLPVTNVRKSRYSYVMGSRFVLPIGVAILVLLVFFSAKKTQPQTVLELPATITKQNVNDSIKKVDIGISAGMDDMDKDLDEIDQDSSNEKLDDESSIDEPESIDQGTQENTNSSDKETTNEDK